ncbi:putative nadh-cytochrome b5 [Phaeomoniella chlamydospora]|uniref:NADH-cytochrome b5 reductase n=1 Tax=Phaeomoniella chlamydospora TaxID=158046 RepID=A0A0G2H1X3_PHACM|nr:putative nadh-cytochrome b5 [Phaeomoniella chlamydospora]
MFARASLRVAQPLKHQVRTYASEATKSSSKAPLYLTLAALPVGYGAYRYFGTSETQKTVADLGKKAFADTGDAPKTFTGGDQGFVSLKLKKIVPYNHNTSEFIFELPSGDHVSGLNIASAILTKYQSEKHEKPTLRPYTPISDEDEKGQLTLLVKKYPNGPMSEHLHSMAPGQRLDFKGPLPKYPWEANKHEHIALIAGGTGITPMYQLIRAIFKNPEDKTKVTLIFGNLKEEDILLKKELQDLENTYPRRFKAFYTLDTPPESWPYGKGAVTKELLKTVLPEPKENNIKVFVCGPPGMYKAISGMKVSPTNQGELTGMLKDLGYTSEQVYKF